MSELPTLVVGATGLLGGEIVRELRANGRAVRALVRPGSNRERKDELERSGAKLVLGDLKDPASLATACRDIGSVVSTATSLLSSSSEDSIESVDRLGQLALVDAADRAGVDQFVFLSFPPAVDSEFQRAKREVEARVRERKGSFTIIRATSFAELWLGPYLGFDPLRGHARVFGDGSQPTSWISMKDVARIAAAAAGPMFEKQMLLLGGPEALSYHDILGLFALNGARNVDTEYVPTSVLEALLRAATDPKEEAFAAAMLQRARGQVADTDQSLVPMSASFTRMSDLVARWAAAVRSI